MTSATPSNDKTPTWRDVRTLADAATRRHLRRLVHTHADAFARDFYRELLADPQAARLIDSEIVNRRLHASMVRWLETLFDDDTPIEALIAAQRKTGELHGRIGVAHAALAAGARSLKRGIVRVIAADADARAVQAIAVQYAYELVDIAIATMVDTEHTSLARLVRSDESVRLFFLTQNLRAEHERQRSQLLEWARDLLLRNYWDVASGPVERSTPRVAPFELWIEHRASLLFQDAPELAAIRTTIEAIDRRLVPRLRSAREKPAQARGVVSELNRQVETIQRLLGTLFDRAAAMEDGHDRATRLLGRRFFPAIMRREIERAQAGHPSFSVLVVDVDRFDDVRHALGADAADGLLAQVADALSERVRAADFLFRTGDNQLTVLLVETEAAEAQQAAEQLRATIADLVLRSPGGLAPRLTASIGVAAHDAHPDYQRLIERAEAALRRARQGGGNRVELAGVEA